jgi:peptidoglycan/xylan/chitin deacetylase (PgdA/CDA1 family)
MDSLIGMTGQRLVIPVYHLISDNPPLHVRHLYKVKNEKQFIHDLDFLLAHYKPIDLPALLDIVKNGKKVDRNVFILTFDDGLREFHDVIAPVLVKKGIPAINFLNSDFMGNKDLFFRYKASLLIDALTKDVSLLKKESVRDWMKANSALGTRDLKSALLGVHFHKRDQLDKLAILAGVDFSDYLDKQRPYLDKEQVKTLIAQGFYFGAHSCNHPEYQYLGMDAQLKQTRDSVEEITKTFNLDYRLFAFPFTDFGVKKAFFEKLNEKGRMADLTFGSAGLKNDPVPFHLQRIPLELAGLGAGEVMRSEYLYYMLKKAFRKNTIKRA